MTSSFQYCMTKYLCLWKQNAYYYIYSIEIYSPNPSGQFLKYRHVAPYIGQPYIITMDIVHFIWSACFHPFYLYTSNLRPSPHPFTESLSLLLTIITMYITIIRTIVPITWSERLYCITLNFMGYKLFFLQKLYDHEMFIHDN